MISEDLPTIAISQDRALEIAAREYDPDALGAKAIDGFLERVTEAGTLRTPQPIRDRSIWIVKLSGMEHPAPGMAAIDGTVQTRFLSTAYIFLDAETAEFLSSTWVE